MAKGNGGGDGADQRLVIAVALVEPRELLETAGAVAVRIDHARGLVERASRVEPEALELLRPEHVRMEGELIEHSVALDPHGVIVRGVQPGLVQQPEGEELAEVGGIDELRQQGGPPHPDRGAGMPQRMLAGEFEPV